MASPPLSNVAMPRCCLESLPADIQINLMSTAGSFDDLKALLCASPIFLRTFVAAKATILLALLVRDLGPGLRDGIALAQTQGLQIGHENYYEEIEKAMVRHQAFRNRPWSTIIRDISMQTIICTIKLSRAVQYFVNLYASIRFDFLRRKMLAVPIKIDELSTTERQRISQAFLRSQTIMNLCGGYDRCYPEYVIRKLVDFFQSWEMEQISEVTAFTATICFAVGSIDVTNLTPPTTQNMSSLGTSRPKASHYLRQYFCDIQKFHALLDSASRADTTLIEQLKSQRTLTENKFLSTEGVGFKFLGASHESWLHHGPMLPFDDPNTLEKLDFADDSASNPPFAWVDARDGWSGNRWGNSLHEKPPVILDNSLYQAIRAEVDLWRWIGYVFWDKKRVEQFKEIEALSAYRTGWLRDLWDRIRIVVHKPAMTSNWSDSESEDEE